MSDEVSSFLRSVEQLNTRRDEEEETRSKELEEKLLQQRKERQARREERARSISPQKSSPANTPPPSARRKDSSTSQAIGTPTLACSPIPHGSDNLHRQLNTLPQSAADAMDLPSPRSIPPTKPHVPDVEVKEFSSTPASPLSSIVLPRTPTLSWQRRPTSQGPDHPRSRPLSMVAAEKAAAARSSTTPAENSSQDRVLSRDQMSQALASKDASFFRQTADRGKTSAAYRKSQVEDVDTVEISSNSQLPGMSRPASVEAEKEAIRERPISQVSLGRLGSPLQMTDAQKLGPPTDIESGYDGTSTGRASPTRATSPTKGMGGFVQSAMMKRTDSVKRWSVNTPGLQRGNTIANRSSMDGKNTTASPGPDSPSRPISRSRESLSRPTSSHARDVATPIIDVTPDKETVLLEISRAESSTEKTPPTSPMRTMDPKRWSPTKGSWLDAALNKPELPKPKLAAPPSNQPAWMVELNRIKAERAKNPIVEPGRAGSAAKKHEVKTGGLVRPAPMGTPAKSPGLGSTSSPNLGVNKPSAPALHPSAMKPSPDSERRGADAEVSERRGSVTSPVLMDKPETLPQQDFRAGLRPRGTTIGKDERKAQNNELANVFGSLRKTKTQNYIAPDTLKDNITRGKAALSLTGGPRPYEKKDEFKDAILKKKADFKLAKEEGRGVATNVKPQQETAVPEGLARRATISRPSSVSEKHHSRNTSAVKSTFETSVQGLDSSRSSVHSVLSSREDSEDVGEAVTQKSDTAPMGLVEKERNARRGKLQIKTGGSALADRFNPALAGLLARGPPVIGAALPNSSLGPDASEAGIQPGPGPKLEHITKGRARGPRRKAPTSRIRPTQATELKDIASPLLASTSSEHIVDAEAKISPTISTQEPNLGSAVLLPRSPVKSVVGAPIEVFKVTTSQDKSHENKIIPVVDSAEKRISETQSLSAGSRFALEDSSRTKVSNTPGLAKSFHEQVSAWSAKTQPADDKIDDVQPPSPRKLDMRRMSKFLEEANQSWSKSERETLRSASPSKEAFSGPSSPRKLDVESEKVDSQPIFSVRNGTSMFGGPVTPTKSRPSTGKSFPAPSDLRPRSPTKMMASRELPASPSALTQSQSPPLATPTRSPSKSALDVSAMFKGLFGDERPKRSYSVDAAALLTNRPSKISGVQTQNAQLFQITEKGNKIPVPSHYERVLFEREMYMCLHEFLNEAGKKASEVYFWAGDEVAQSLVEDAQVFINREARSMGGALIEIGQGKETAEFIQALGGIVVIRRGSSNKYDSLACHMLCGRQHLGQFVFDEVDFSPSVLCSGFTYLVTQQGKCYLWKGKGSGINEMSCARLIGMDLALMGELIEMEEGQEPEDFWTLFDGARKAASADHWRLKPSYDKYCGRLFRSDAADQRQIQEISPYNQLDLSPNSIYILDAFFEIYIIVGREAQLQYASFHNALDFAQEYAILAAGMEDRPFVPVSTVVLEGIPRDLRSCFRKWTDDLSPTKMVANRNGPSSAEVSASPLKRSKSLRVIPLGQALQALDTKPE